MVFEHEGRCPWWLEIRGGQRHRISLELVSWLTWANTQLTWVLGTELVSSGRALAPHAMLVLFII